MTSYFLTAVLPALLGLSNAGATVSSVQSNVTAICGDRQAQINFQNIWAVGGGGKVTSIKVGNKDYGDQLDKIKAAVGDSHIERVSFINCTQESDYVLRAALIMDSPDSKRQGIPNMLFLIISSKGIEIE